MNTVRVPSLVLRQVVSHLSRADINETAVPSYTHPNPLIRWLFRRRLEMALDLARIRPGDRVLDFGTGSGILLPTLHRCTDEVWATDLDISPAQSLVSALHLPTRIVPLGSFADWRSQHAQGIDAIMALDVFEHLDGEQLPLLAGQLHALLAPGGRLVVCGPTETPMYRLGRLLAGFKNVYHYRSIFDIDAQLQPRWIAEEAHFLPRVPRAFMITRYTPRAE